MHETYDSNIRAVSFENVCISNYLAFKKLRASIGVSTFKNGNIGPNNSFSIKTSLSGTLTGKNYVCMYY